MRPLRLVGVAGASVLEVVRLVVVEPIREGRLRASAWPYGLRPVAALSVAAFVVAGALVVGGSTVRAHSTLTAGLGGDLVFPRWTLFVFAGLTVLALALLHAASLHLAWWLRILVLIVVVIVLLTSVLAYYDQQRSSSVVSWVGCALLAVLTAFRWRAAFAWWEFPASLLVIGATTAEIYRLGGNYGGPLGFDVGPSTLSLTIQSLAILALPFIFISGVAFAQLALLLTLRVGTVVEERVRSAVPLVILVVVLAATDVVLGVRRLRAPTDYGVSHLLVLGSSLGLLLVALVVVGRFLLSQRPQHELGRLEDTIGVVAMPIALVFTALTIVQLLVGRVDTQLVRSLDLEKLPLKWLDDGLSGNVPLTTARFGGGVLLVAWAVWRRRRAPVPAAIAGCVGLALMVGWTRRVTGGLLHLVLDPDGINDAATLVVLVALVVLALRRELTRRRLLALAAALGIGLAWSVRSTFDAPFVALFGLGSTAAVFLGLVWAMLTDASEANEDSARYPRPARVMFFFGNGILAMTVLAFAAVSRNLTIGLDTGAFGGLGDAYFGTGLLLAAYALLAVAVVRDDPPLPQSTREAQPAA